MSSRTPAVPTVLIVVCLALLAIRWSAVSRSAPAPPEPDITYRPVRVAEDGDVSSRTCRACHPTQYASWHGSYHRTMTQLATPDAVRASFDGVRVDGVQEKPMLLERRG